MTANGNDPKSITGAEQTESAPKAEPIKPSPPSAKPAPKVPPLVIGEERPSAGEKEAEEKEPNRLDVRPCLVIGVGGTGILAVKAMKARMRELTRGHDAPFIRYLVLDTTTEDPKPPKLDVGEFSNIGQLDFNEIVGHISDYPHLSYWFPVKKFKPMQLGLGAMGVRHIGRLCYFQWRESSRVRDRIQNKIEALVNPSLPDKIRELGFIQDLRVDQTSGIDIHIVASGGGGTGSGIFLDLAYDLRKWAKELARSARVMGHLVLPDVFGSVVPEPLMPYVESNSHALLSEIDHFMDHGGWDVKYESERVSAGDQAPFDLLYLLGRNGHDGGARDKQDLVTMIGCAMANLAFSPVGKMLLDYAVNLIPPILSQSDETYHKPCAYGSYGLSIGVARAGDIESAA